MRRGGGRQERRLPRLLLRHVCEAGGTTRIPPTTLGSIGIDNVDADSGEHGGNHFAGMRDGIGDGATDVSECKPGGIRTDHFQDVLRVLVSIASPTACPFRLFVLKLLWCRSRPCSLICWSAHPRRAMDSPPPTFFRPCARTHYPYSLLFSACAWQEYDHVTSGDDAFIVAAGRSVWALEWRSTGPITRAGAGRRASVGFGFAPLGPQPPCAWDVRLRIRCGYDECMHSPPARIPMPSLDSRGLGCCIFPSGHRRPPVE